MNKIWMALFLVLVGPARADVPRVVVDIAPVGGLVASVMGDLGTPDVIVSPGASPHDFSLRPSQARALSEADVVVWIGPGLTPWLERSLAALSGGAAQLELLHEAGTHLLPVRGDDGDHDHGHDHGEHDPHAWLDPDNAVSWLTAIAETLSAVDPGNAPIYAANAAAAQARLGVLSDEIAVQVAGARFMTFHDGYQYFEARFAVPAVGVVSPSDEHDPSAQDVAHAREVLTDAPVPCLLMGPEGNRRVAKTVLEGFETRIVPVDPLGHGIVVDADHYGSVLRGIATALQGCR